MEQQSLEPMNKLGWCGMMGNVQVRKLPARQGTQADGTVQHASKCLMDALTMVVRGSIASKQHTQR